MLSILSVLNIGFSTVSAAALFVIYAFFLKSIEKTWQSIATCGFLLLGIICLQIQHFYYFQHDTDPLATIFYQFCLFAIPPNFYIFSHTVLFPDAKLKIWTLAHYLPIPLLLLIPPGIAIPMTFLCGMAYSFWLANIIYSLRGKRNQFETEFFFFGLFFIIALFVLILGFSVPYIDNSYFYYFYSNSIGLVFILIVTTLIVFPNLLGELSEAVTLKYAASTLKGVDVASKVAELNQLMSTTKIYQNEDLSLSILADEMEMTSHQLSELINSQFGIGFSKYIRNLRVGQAKSLLVNQPNASVLSIGMETGFKSQSNFYAAFREVTGESPGNYRKIHSTLSSS